MNHVRGAPFHPQTQGKIERWHQTLKNVTPADAYFGRAETIIKRRERIKRKTFEHRRLQYRKLAA